MEEEEESKPKEDHPVVDTEVKQTWSEEKWQAWRAAWLEAGLQIRGVPAELPSSGHDSEVAV